MTERLHAPLCRTPIITTQDLTLRRGPTAREAVGDTRLRAGSVDIRRPQPHRICAMKAMVQRWDNSVALRIPKAFAEQICALPAATLDGVTGKAQALLK